MSRTKHENFTPREVNAMLSNAVLAVSRSPQLAGMTETRRRKIRVFTEAVVQALLQDCDDEKISGEELVYVLSTSALFVYTLRVLKSGTPMSPAFQDFAARLLEDATNGAQE